MNNWQQLGLAWLRILAGVGIATHGFGKLFGGRMAGFTEGVAGLGFPMPAVFAWAAALSEFAGGICLAAGLWTRIAAGFLFITMSVALFLRHAHDPFRTKELAYLYWTIAGAVALLGPGRLTLGAMLKRTE